MIELGINLEVRDKDEARINLEVWYTPESVGELEITPFQITIMNPEIPIRVKQYPMSQEGKKGLKQGLLEPCMSPRNTPMLPVKNHRITESQNSRGWKGPLWVI